VVDKWDILIEKVDIEVDNVVSHIRNNDGHVGQITRVELKMLKKFKDIIKQSEEAEQDFYDTVSGSGG
jgi:hypothetical protein